MREIEAVEQKKRLALGKIDAPFVICPDCHGTGYHALELSGHVNLCDTCLGSGRFYFREDKAAIYLWWERLPMWKRANYVFMGAFTGALLFVVFVMWLAGFFN